MLERRRLRAMEFLKQSMAVREIARRLRAAVGSVISRGDSAVDLQVNDRALDAVAFAIHALVPADFGLAIGLGQNAGTDPTSAFFESKPESRVSQFVNSDLERDRSSFPPYDQRTFALSRRAPLRRGVCGFRVALLHRSDQRGFVLAVRWRANRRSRVLCAVGFCHCLGVRYAGTYSRGVRSEPCCPALFGDHPCLSPDRGTR